MSINIVNLTFNRLTQTQEEENSKEFTYLAADWFIPSREDLQINQYWINENANYNALGGADFNDFVSGAGGKWGESVNGVADYYYDIPAHHAEFWKMVKNPYIRLLAKLNPLIVKIFKR